jgi:hypothetical protein
MPCHNSWGPFIPPWLGPPRKLFPRREAFRPRDKRAIPIVSQAHAGIGVGTERSGWNARLQRDGRHPRAGQSRDT